VAQSLQWRVRQITAGCTTADDCSLNGKCEGGKCVCTPAWKGDSCEILNLKDGTPSSLGYHGVDGTINLSSWGGSAHRGKNGTYHLIASEIGHGVGMVLWGCASRIIHATSPDPLTQPFVKKKVLFESFSHEPRCAYFNSDGGLVCFFAHNPMFHLNKNCAGANGTTPAGRCGCSSMGKGDKQPIKGMPTVMSFVSNIDDDAAKWSEPQTIAVIDPGTDSNLCKQLSCHYQQHTKSGHKLITPSCVACGLTYDRKK
jgi:hypothetical protein